MNRAAFIVEAFVRQFHETIGESENPKDRERVQAILRFNSFALFTPRTRRRQHESFLVPIACSIIKTVAMQSGDSPMDHEPLCSVLFHPLRESARDPNFKCPPGVFVAMLGPRCTEDVQCLPRNVARPFLPPKAQQWPGCGNDV
ncbi:hypothetical protein KM043_006876 [Ampulex compressa]|nr:hypothetical protein KM043_006876 [Ampulex compressa]